MFRLPLPAFTTFVVVLALSLVLTRSLPVTAQSTSAPAQTEAEVESLARQVARLEVQRYAIWRENLDRVFDADTQARLAALGADRAALLSRLRPEADGFTPVVRFNDRVRAIVAAEIGLSWNQLMLERFPTPERLRVDHPDDLRYLAALIVVGYEFGLGRTISPPRSPELQARDAAYSRAIAEVEGRIKPPAENIRASQQHEDQLYGLTRSAAFKREILNRYIPLFASFVPDDTPGSSVASGSESESILFRVIWQRDNDPANDVPLGLVLIPAICLLAILGSVWSVWSRTWRSGRRDNARPGSAAMGAVALDLPAELRFPVLPGRMKPDLALNVGHIVDASTWSETHISTSTVPGNQYQPAQTHVSSTTVQKDRLWLRGIDGREQEWTVTGGVIAARPGHLLALVLVRERGGGERLALAYNHHSGGTYDPDWLAAAHAHPIGVWILALLFWVAPLVLLADWLIRQMGEDFSAPLLSGATTLAGALFVWSFVVRWWVLHRRRGAWRHKYRPRVLEILQRFGRELDRPDAG
jgi:hypothetical protein